MEQSEQTLELVVAQVQHLLLTVESPLEQVVLVERLAPVEAEEEGQLEVAAEPLEQAPA